MAFFEGLGKKITQVGQNAVQKTKDVTEIAKLNGAISDAEKAINSNYNAIGKLYMLRHSDDYEAEFAVMVCAIKDLEAKINDCNEQIRSIKGVTRCEKCGNELLGHVSFCSDCGAPVPRPQPAERTVHCTGCGAVIESGMRFCTACGKAIDEATAETEDEERICPNCKNTIEDDSLFCTKCGTKL